ncbi:uncharacterized protein DEA37_0001344 [Paragonimus westermani]|uniref:LIM zinc-binding domain-containing protein n=1 Tax=Paragonimus westermani TaxID=34504 RepID=A0A5J4ND79_9TREM|nr:uncharacterized protein DEA37_0001344 [Paragonimus westermani]
MTNEKLASKSIHFFTHLPRSYGTQASCERCAEPFDAEENIVSSRDKLFHVQCFVCSQCFQPLSYSEFYEFEGRRYCKYDFQMLFAPFCHKCGEFIMTKVIKAMQRSWHPECLVCEECNTPLAATGLQKFRGKSKLYEIDLKPVCKECYERLPTHWKRRLAKWHLTEPAK